MKEIRSRFDHHIPLFLTRIKNWNYVEKSLLKNDGMRVALFDGRGGTRRSKPIQAGT
jgi:hypothetical protein